MKRSPRIGTRTLKMEMIVKIMTKNMMMRMIVTKRGFNLNQHKFRAGAKQRVHKTRVL
jgi:hypothetical protein